MEKQDEVAAPAATAEDIGRTTTVGLVDVHEGTVSTDMVHHPTDPPVPIDPVPEPPKMVASDPKEETADVSESALEEADGTGDNSRRYRHITLGDTVYYGDGTGAVHPAIITHVYGRAADNDEDRNDTYVDLQVLKRKFICDVEKVAQHNLPLGGALNGWVFKA